MRVAQASGGAPSAPAQPAPTHAQPLSAIVPIGGGAGTDAEAATVAARLTTRSLLHRHVRTVFTVTALGLAYSAAMVPVIVASSYGYGLIQSEREEPWRSQSFADFDWSKGDAGLQRYIHLVGNYMLIPLLLQRTVSAAYDGRPHRGTYVAGVFVSLLPPLAAHLDPTDGRLLYIVSALLIVGVYVLVIRRFAPHPLVRKCYRATMLLFMYGLVVVLFIFPILVLGASTDSQRLWVRVLTFPLITDLASGPVRGALLDMGDTLPEITMLPLEYILRMWSATTGRFVIFSIEDPGTRAWCVVGVAAVELLLRLSMPYRRQLRGWLRGRREEAPDDRTLLVVASQILADEFAETVGTVGTAAIFISMRMSRTRAAPDPWDTVESALLQLAAELMTDLVAPLLLMAWQGRRNKAVEGRSGLHGAMQRRVVMDARALRLWTAARSPALAFYMFLLVTGSSLLSFAGIVGQWRSFFCAWSKHDGWWHSAPW